MYKVLSLVDCFLVVGIALFLAGCSGGKSGHEAASDAEKPALIKPTKAKAERITTRPANLMGTVFVAEYHHIRAGKGEMFRTPKQFREDLENYYSLGFRPVLASEFLANKMPLPPGASPIVITFDDSMPTQLQLEPDGSVSPDCAVGIWHAFAKEHPDFPVHATFYVLADHLWTTNEVDPRKAKLVLSLGCELANHTIHHPQLRRLTDAKVKWELATANDKLEELGQALPVSLALPYGVFPKNRKILKGFDWKGKHVSFTGVFLSGAGPARSPNDPKFNALRVPRILATTVPFGLDYWLKKLKDGQLRPLQMPYVQP